MKKVPFALVLAFGLASGSAFAASSGSVTVNGEVVGATCQVGTDEKDQIIDLVKVGQDDLTVVGAKVAPLRFEIKLTGCTPAASVSAVFSADNPNLIDTASGTLRNNYEAGILPEDPQAAVGVNIALYRDSGEQIKLGNQSYVSGTARVVPADGALTLTYAAAYYATGSVTPGKVKAKANYIIAYQ